MAELTEAGSAAATDESDRPRIYTPNLGFVLAHVRGL